MVEPVGFAASITALLDLAKKVVEYITDAYHASNECNEILIEVTCNQEILLQLQQKSKQEQWADIIKVLDMKHGPLQRLEKALKSLVRCLKPSNNHLKTLGKAMSWPTAKTEYQEIFSSLERSKSLLMLALQKDLM